MPVDTHLDGVWCYSEEPGSPDDAILHGHRWKRERDEAREALRMAIKLARDFNRGAMTWKEYDRKLAALEAEYHAG